jgi:hypothetical protein
MGRVAGAHPELILALQRAVGDLPEKMILEREGAGEATAAHWPKPMPRSTPLKTVERRGCLQQSCVSGKCDCSRCAG